MTASDIPPVPDLPLDDDDPTADPDAREWFILECLDGYHDETGRPGRHREPVSDLSHLYTRAEAWSALHKWVHLHPDREFSMRRVSSVEPVLDTIAKGI